MSKKRNVLSVSPLEEKMVKQVATYILKNDLGIEEKSPGFDIEKLILDRVNDNGGYVLIKYSYIYSKLVECASLNGRKNLNFDHDLSFLVQKEINSRLSKLGLYTVPIPKVGMLLGSINGIYHAAVKECIYYPHVNTPSVVYIPLLKDLESDTIKVLNCIDDFTLKYNPNKDYTKEDIISFDELLSKRIVGFADINVAISMTAAMINLYARVNELPGDNKELLDNCYILSVNLNDYYSGVKQDGKDILCFGELAMVSFYSNKLFREGTLDTNHEQLLSFKDLSIDNGNTCPKTFDLDKLEVKTNLFVFRNKINTIFRYSFEEKDLELVDKKDKLDTLFDKLIEDVSANIASDNIITPFSLPGKKNIFYFIVWENVNDIEDNFSSETEDKLLTIINNFNSNVNISPRIVSIGDYFDIVDKIAKELNVSYGRSLRLFTSLVNKYKTIKLHDVSLRISITNDLEVPTFLIDKDNDVIDSIQNYLLETDKGNDVKGTFEHVEDKYPHAINVYNYELSNKTDDSLLRDLIDKEVNITDYKVVTLGEKLLVTNSIGTYELFNGTDLYNADRLYGILLFKSSLSDEDIKERLLRLAKQNRLFIDYRKEYGPSINTPVLVTKYNNLDKFNELLEIRQINTEDFNFGFNEDEDIYLIDKRTNKQLLFIDKISVTEQVNLEYHEMSTCYFNDIHYTTDENVIAIIVIEDHLY